MQTYSLVIKFKNRLPGDLQSADFLSPSSFVRDEDDFATALSIAAKAGHEDEKARLSTSSLGYAYIARERPRLLLIRLVNASCCGWLETTTSNRTWRMDVLVLSL